MNETFVELAAQLCAIDGALAELSRWPDLPGVPYFVYMPGDGAKRTQIRGNDVEGIFDAIHKHIRTLNTYGRSAVEAYERQPGLIAKATTGEALWKHLYEYKEILFATAFDADCPHSNERIAEELSRILDQHVV